MSDQTYLTVAYICMIGGLALWTWTVFARSKSLQEKIDSLEKAMNGQNNSENIDANTPDNVLVEDNE
ncbi:MAG: hypothetical protein CMA39_00105 [Euryarchaeota archaeon]|jgi:hypothetical protein|nr:hypothetical protein [Euryarchaeota archaeon]MCH2647417.1 hypothetical protein [Candidatus Poseidoniaceae archaeon]RAH13037.1 MAG: hypothetical protein CMB05_002765 [Euryarchaeota archaeon]DAC38082.1 MAG TPA: hypothetical protein D7H83_07100 [Candidatus Poseidoniales archaeon]HIH58147.1 hypothetical protein [Candidatus Poseidoniaceae archaeon]|tara:strand:+ start:789 stop:989 length:201 start_codon:yes stop_codon:yes gene_type:complete